MKCFVAGELVAEHSSATM